MISGKDVFPDGERLVAEYLGKFNDVKALPETSAEIACIGRSNSYGFVPVARNRPGR